MRAVRLETSKYFLKLIFRHRRARRVIVIYIYIHTPIRICIIGRGRMKMFKGLVTVFVSESKVLLGCVRYRYFLRSPFEKRIRVRTKQTRWPQTVLRACADATMRPRSSRVHRLGVKGHPSYNNHNTRVRSFPSLS